ncbi:MAG TPA: phosphatase PAP2 family protein [Pseudonocardiaceae bacterium]|nr:phosphatase PAP2 family protein [Pseudonocardiaceae bacterium]
MFDRLGTVTKSPLAWVLVTVGLAAAGGSTGRQAALRGYACYLFGGAAGNLPKPLFGRAQPRHHRPRKPEVIRGAFPSGHAAAEVAYVFGASLEAPVIFLPLATMALSAHLSLIKNGEHYLSDTLVGGIIGLAVVALTAKAWPPHTTFLHGRTQLAEALAARNPTQATTTHLIEHGVRSRGA